jgi:type II secretory pathway pseudopilin PulG
LIASLMPRMQTAQGRARDVARKNDLSQIQTAIITSQSDRGSWPGMKKNGSETDEANN